ncbi:hypothetical protein APUTEX25_000968 [Auxenochlorella protothecoides]|uniref:Uncharacterized protein n=1 Tax=Auxenochlorella protothecoides TaxID=3075 RepID=A0A3M7KSL3_AUXPR|nr:hypothetical protein APUTEX25_000968 [Auxenochlorella protothecoides]|eukprot:RMZ52849.1 hypothetical protein APUTEX25_000968 [Auxenochlorella protothecoides]
MLLALKAYSLIKLEYLADGLQILEDIVKEGPESDRVLSIMAYAYKDADSAGDFTKQQATALQLIKLSPDAVNYLWWAAVSAAMQARASIQGQASALPTASLLTLAGRLMDRALDRTPPSAFTFEMLLVVLDVLLASGQHARAAALLEGSRARKACTSPTDLSFLCAAVAAGAREQEAAARRCREVLAVSPHDWAAARLCLDCLLAQGWSGRTLRCRWPVWVVGGLTDTMLEREPGSQEDQTAPEPLGEVQRRVLADWSDEWGSNLPPPDCSGSASPNKRTQEAGLQALSNGYQVEFELGLPRHTSGDQARGAAAALLTTYAAALPLSAGLDAKQRGHGEDLVTLAVTRLLQGHALDLHGLLPSALFVLEAAQATRTSSAPLRLHAAALYALLGCPRAAAMQLEALGVKQILHDSMTAHWLLPALLDSGAIAAAGEALDTWVWLGSALPLQVAEFVSFKERLAASHALHVVRAEEAIRKLRLLASSPVSPHTLVKAARHLEEQAPPLPTRISFNEDLGTRPAWFPPGATSASELGPALALRPCGLWWRAPSAASRATCAEAQAWRSAQRAKLEWRRGLPRMLAAALDGAGPDAGSEDAEGDSGLPADPAGIGDGEYAHGIWEVLMPAARACWAALRCEAGTEAPKCAAAPPACAALSAVISWLQVRFSAWSDRLEVAQQGLVNDPLLHLSLAISGGHARFVAEEALWAAHALKAWLAAAGGAQGASDGNLDMCADIQRALSCLREGLGSLREVLEALSLAAAQLPDAYDLVGADAKLWGFAPGYDARLVHDTTVAEQRQGLEQLQAQAASVLRILD